MIDKALLENFNGYFGGSQTKALLQIKAEIDLFGLEEFKDIAWVDIQNNLIEEPLEQSRIFKNAIFTVIQHITIDEDEDAYRLIVLAFNAWTALYFRNLEEFGTVGLVNLNDLVNEAFYYSTENLNFDERNPELVVDGFEKLTQLLNIHEDILRALNNLTNKTEVFLWNCVDEKWNEDAYLTKFGSIAQRNLIPQFYYNNFYLKCVYFHMSILRRIYDVDIAANSFKELAEKFFFEQTEILKTNCIEPTLAKRKNKFCSLYELIEKTRCLYELAISTEWGFEERDWKRYDELITTLKSN